MKPLLTVLTIVATAAGCLAATDESLDHRATLPPGGRFGIDVDFGSIEITTNATRDVVITVARTVDLGSEAREKAYLAERPVTFETEADRLVVRSRKGGGVFNRGNWGWGHTKLKGLYTVSLPADCSLDLHTSGGSIRVTGTQAAVKAHTSGGSLRFVGLRGPLDGGTSGGKIEVSESTGELLLNTSGGSIEVHGGSGTLNSATSGGSIRVRNFAGPARIRSSGGSLTLENVAGAVTGSTSGGSISAVIPSPFPGAVRLDTSGGSITVKLPEAAAFNLDASTSGGGVSSDLPVQMEGKKKRNQLKGPVNGGGPTVELHTSGGGIHVKAAPAALR